jgi:hypothetical protein
LAGFAPLLSQAGGREAGDEEGQADEKYDYDADGDEGPVMAIHGDSCRGGWGDKLNGRRSQNGGTG